MIMVSVSCLPMSNNVMLYISPAGPFSVTSYFFPMDETLGARYTVAVCNSAMLCVPDVLAIYQTKDLLCRVVE